MSKKQDFYREYLTLNILYYMYQNKIQLSYDSHGAIFISVLDNCLFSSNESF